MKLTKSKGFTLIELLAVIVILAIILLIATPIILNIIDDARKGSFKSSAGYLVKAAENKYMKNQMNDKIEDIVVTYVNGKLTSSIDLDYRGEKPKNGTIVVRQDGKVGIAIDNGKWCAIKNYEEEEVKLIKLEEDNCKLSEVGDNHPDVGIDDGKPLQPKLNDNIIPIRWSVNKWVKADVSSEWYDYENGEWANAVLVNDATRNFYKNANPSTEVKEEDILAYLVWIPRFRYKLFNVDFNKINPAIKSVDVEFEKIETIKSVGSQNGEFLTHPAFTFDDTELSGFWIGKFETTGTMSNPTVKPNLSSIRSNIRNSHYEINSKFNDSQIYGVTSDYDAHLAKNLEWGAVLYLTYSIKYGYQTNLGLSYIGRNKSSTFLTGCYGESDANGCIYKYDNIHAGPRASTTGTIYGVYDMSGGARDAVMGVSTMINNKVVLGDSGFNDTDINKIEFEKYLDKYIAQGTKYQSKLGDGIEEFGGNLIYMNATSTSWLDRGGPYTTTSHLGEIGSTNGGNDSYVASRLVIN